MIRFDGLAAFTQYPRLEVAFLVAPASPPRSDGDPAELVVRRVTARHVSAEALAADPLVESYRRFHAAMNVRPSAASTPLKQAARVFAKGYRPIHPVVDICMEIEYATLCSFQVYDRERLGQSVAYRMATGDEQISERAHGGGPAKLRAGELALVDELGVIHSPGCGNAASRVVTAETGEVVVRVLKIPELDTAVYRSAVDEAAERLGASHVVSLDARNPVGDVDA